MPLVACASTHLCVPNYFDWTAMLIYLNFNGIHSVLEGSVNLFDNLSGLVIPNSKSHIQIIKDIWCHQPGRHNLIGSYEKNQNFESSHHANYFRKYDSHISTTVAAILPSLREQDRDLNQL